MSSVFDALQLQRIAQAIEDGQAGATATATVNLDFSNVGDMTGATAGTAGTHGLVPAPAAGDQDKTLHGDGSWRVNSADLPQVFGSSSGPIITLADAADYAASDLVIDIDPVQSGSGDPAPDNIRPISGWTGANISIGGENIYNQNNITASGGGRVTVTAIGDKSLRVSTGTNGVSYAASIQQLSNYNLEPNARYVVKATVHVVSGVPHMGIRNSTTNTFIASAGEIHEGVNYFEFTTPSVGAYLSFLATWASTSVGDVYYQDITISKINKTHPITFPSEAGTVYGGTLDVTNGTLTVTKANIASYAGETLPGTWISDRDVYDPDNPTAPTTGAQVVYDLDTPLTYQVISTDVYLTSGTCSVWANTGDIITLKYVKSDYNDIMRAVPKMKMPDYSAAIASGTYNLFDGFNYTAVKDCIIYVMIGCDSSLSYPFVSVNNNSLGYIWSNTSGIEFPLFIALNAGDVLDVSATTQGNNWTENYIVFALN